MKLFSKIKSRFLERRELERDARLVARIIMQGKSTNETTMSLLTIMADNGSPVAHSALEHLARENNARAIEGSYDLKTDTITLKYIGVK